MPRKTTPPRTPPVPLVGEWSFTRHGPWGWFCLNSFLCIEIGTRLTYWAEHANSYPAGAGRSWTAAEWSAELARHGQALLAFAALLDGGDDDTDETNPKWEAAATAAKAALHFLADNLATLWD